MLAVSTLRCQASTETWLVWFLEANKVPGEMLSTTVPSTDLSPSQAAQGPSQGSGCAAWHCWHETCCCIEAIGLGTSRHRNVVVSSDMRGEGQPQEQGCVLLGVSPHPR